MREMPYSRMPSGQILNNYGINLNPCVMVLASKPPAGVSAFPWHGSC